MKLHVKVHCPQKKMSQTHTDPRTGDHINQNFLTHYCSHNVGALAHTVQLYSLDDPAPTYNGESFKHIEDYIFWQAEKRDVMFFGESAYWIGYDVDVPLFLPLYANRRLHDYRYLAAKEAEARVTLEGMTLFDSGWEWGYWLNDVVAARGMWDPLLDMTEDEAFRHLIRPMAMALGGSQECARALGK